MDDFFEKTDDESLWDKIRYLYWRIIPYEYRPSSLWYRFKCWLWYRYTTVKPRYLGHGWQDRDYLLVATMFEILCEFYEKECSDTNFGIDWTYRKIIVDGQERCALDLIRDLVNYWKWYNEEVPKIQDKMQDDYWQYRPKPFFKKYDGDNKHISHVLNTNYESEEQEKKYKENFQKYSLFKEQLKWELEKNLQLILQLREFMWT